MIPTSYPSRLILILAVISLPLCAQVTPSTLPPPTVVSPLTQQVNQSVALQTTVNVATLPGLTIGVGGSWNRGQAEPEASDVTVAIRLSPTSNIYSWSDVNTPVVVHNSGSPIASTVTTGLGYVAAQNKTGSVAVVLIAQTGFTVSTTGTSPAFEGSIGVPIRLGKSSLFVMPYFKCGSPALGTNGALASFVIQPGVQFLYSFSK